jgi:hypothetical protein
MTYYQVSLRGHPVALVKTIDLARTIVRCRRRGYYAVEKVESVDDIPLRIKQHQKTSAPKRPAKTTSKLGKSKSRSKTVGKPLSPTRSKSR